MLSGKDAFAAYEVLLTAPVTRLARTGRWIEASSVFILCGLAVLVPYKIRALNFSLPAQVMAGAFAAYLVFTITPTPDFPALLLACIAAAAAGALVAAVPGALKALLGANEIVTGLMLVPIVQGLLSLVGEPLLSAANALDFARNAVRNEPFGFLPLSAISQFELGVLHTGVLITPFACLAAWPASPSTSPARMNALHGTPECPSRARFSQHSPLAAHSPASLAHISRSAIQAAQASTLQA